ncbi:MAG: ABC transporter permease [Actinobacteria bacterium]|nr:ABC transporter permease [Actinomycetota bacterium]
MNAGIAEQLRLAWVLVRRGLNEVLRVPGASIPGVVAPTIYMLGGYSVFGRLNLLPGFSGDDYLAWILPTAFIQAGVFTGAATGVNLARDIENGWFDRMLLAPAPRRVLVAGVAGSASIRVLLPCVLILVSGWLAGIGWPGAGTLAISIALAALLAAAMACWACGLAMKFKSQDAAPLMQTSGFIAFQLTAIFAPIALLAPWMRAIAQVNPFTYLLDAVRQGWIGEISWHDTWPGLLAIAGMLALAWWFAISRIRRMDA